MLISIDTEHLDMILANLMILTFLWPLQDEIEKVMETQEKLASEGCQQTEGRGQEYPRADGSTRGHA